MLSCHIDAVRLIGLASIHPHSLLFANIINKNYNREKNQKNVACTCIFFLRVGTKRHFSEVHVAMCPPYASSSSSAMSSMASMSSSCMLSSSTSSSSSSSSSPPSSLFSSSSSMSSSSSSISTSSSYPSSSS